MFCNNAQRRHGLEKESGEEIAIFGQTTLEIADEIPTDRRKFRTEDIIGAKNFNFVSKLFGKWAFYPEILHFRTKCF